MAEDAQLNALDKEIAALQAKREALFQQTRGEALESVLARIATYKFTPAELGLGTAAAPSKRSKGQPKGKLPAKYANPDNPSQTWAGGKGPTPKWVKEKQAAGLSLDDLLIK